MGMEAGLSTGKPVGPGWRPRDCALLKALPGSNMQTKKNGRAGQAMVEYAIVAGLLVVCLGVLSLFFVTFREYSGRIIALVSSDYP